MPERVYRQEHLAEFVDDSGGVFDGVRDAVTEYELPIPPADATGPFAIGVDLARREDYTVVVVLDSEGRLVAFDRRQKVRWTQIQNRVVALAEDYSPSHVAVDGTRDNKIVGDLEDSGLTIEPVNFSSKKRELIDNLALSLEGGEVTLSADATELINELEVFEYDMTDGGRITFSAPSGFHDDCVDALALAIRARESKPPEAGGVVIEW